MSPIKVVDRVVALMDEMEDVNDTTTASDYVILWTKLRGQLKKYSVLDGHREEDDDQS